MARLRLNQEYRNKIANRMRVHLEQEETQEKEMFFQLREQMKPLQDQTWKLAQQIVSRHYTPEDIKMAYHLQNKFENVDTIAKDSCFHFGYHGQVEDRDEHDNVVMKDKYIESHFDFKLNGNINGQENGKQWNEKYQLDLIGRDYCRDRSIACSEDEFKFLIDWKRQKSLFVLSHTKWIESILKQMKEIKLGLKGYKWLDEAIELATELGLSINDAEIIRTNSTGLVIYNPKNLAERIKGMKNTEKTREQKIADRVAYMQQQQINSDNLN